MGINLEKGSSINLDKQTSGINNLHIGLGWDEHDNNSEVIDCDVSVFMIDENNKIPGDGYFIFYNNLKSSDGSVVHQGDNRTGEGDGDDEVINIDLTKVDSSVVQMIFVVTIHDADNKNQSFSSIKNAFLRIVDLNTSNEICNYQLAEQFSEADSIQIGRMYRDNESWVFEALDQGFQGGLSTLLGMYN